MKKQTREQKEYLYEVTRRVVGATTVHDPHMDRIGAICYLYGAEMRYCFVAEWKKKIRENFEGVLGSMLEPWSYIAVLGEPILKYKDEDVIVARELVKANQVVYAYLNWATKEGEEMRKIINPILEKQSKTKEYKEWEKAQRRFNTMFEKWTDAYQKQYPKTIMKFYGYEDGRIAISTKKLQKDAPRHLLNQKQRFAIWKKYNAELDQFASFMQEKFLSGDKMFPDTYRRI